MSTTEPKRNMDPAGSYALERVYFRDDCPLIFRDPWSSDAGWSGSATYLTTEDQRSRPGLRILRNGPTIEFYAGSVKFAEAPTTACKPWPVEYDLATAREHIRQAKEQLTRAASAAEAAAREAAIKAKHEAELAQKQLSDKVASERARINAPPKSAAQTDSSHSGPLRSS